MDVDGYMVRVSFDGTTLTAEGTNKMGRVALAGEDHDAGPVQIPVSEIQRVEFKQASAMVNGKITVHTAAGRKYQLHFRKKQRDGFTALAQQLGAPGA